jgi:hypothetical protein
MSGGQIDEIDFVAPKAADMKPIIKMERYNSGSDENGGNPFGLGLKCFFGLHYVPCYFSPLAFGQAVKALGSISFRSAVEIP